MLGEHRGFWFHTIGQRRGLGLSQGPWFVVQKDCEQNVVYVSHEEHHLEQARDRFEVADAHWINRPEEADAIQVKLRHSEHVYDCRLEGDVDGVVTVHLQGHDPGVAAGQYAVFYRGTECLGGGVIQESRG